MPTLGKKIFGDESSLVILNYEHLCDTIISGNIYLIVNEILESRDLVLSYIHIGIHIGDAKYRI